MDSLSATSLFSALIFIIVFVSSVSTDQMNITAQAGRDTFLPCRSPDNEPVLVLEWIRPDLGSEYVLLLRNDQLDLENQHVMFKDRVDLQDRQMKDGNVALVLRNVTTNDRGAYECRVVQTNSRTETVFIINLDVLPPPGEPDGEKRDGSDGLMIGVVVGLLPLVIIIAAAFAAACFIYKRCKCPKPNQPSVGPAEDQQPLTDQNQPDEQRVQSDLQDDGSRTSADPSSRITD